MPETTARNLTPSSVVALSDDAAHGSNQLIAALERKHAELKKPLAVNVYRGLVSVL